MENNSKFSLLKMILIAWKIGFLVGCLFLLYSLYDKDVGGIIFCVLFLFFIAFLIKKYSSIDDVN